MDQVVWPHGAAEKQTPAYAAILNIEASNSMTVLEPATLTGNCTINVIPHPELRFGSFLFAKIRATANSQDVTFGNFIDAPALVGVAGKTKVQTFIFDGISFVAIGGFVQID